MAICQHIPMHFEYKLQNVYGVNEMRHTDELRESKPSAFQDDIAVENLKIYRSKGN
jgi:hypothetical protein